MFDNIGRNTTQDRRRSAGSVMLAFLLNGSIGGALIWAGSRVVEEVAKEDELLEVAVALAAPPPPPPPAGGHKRQQKPDDVKPVEQVVPTEVVPLVEPESDIEVVEDEGVEGGVEGGSKAAWWAGSWAESSGAARGTLGAIKTVHWSEVQAKKRVAPEYPEAAKAMGLRDREDCVVRMRIGTDGLPKSVEMRACPTVFHDSARTAALQWEFYPLLENGQPIEAQFDLRISFTLK